MLPERITWLKYILNRELYANDPVSLLIVDRNLRPALRLRLADDIVRFIFDNSAGVRFAMPFTLVNSEENTATLSTPCSGLTSTPNDADILDISAPLYLVWNTIPILLFAICLPKSESTSTQYVIVFGLKT